MKIKTVNGVSSLRGKKVKEILEDEKLDAFVIKMDASEVRREYVLGNIPVEVVEDFDLYTGNKGVIMTFTPERKVTIQVA